jgi:hypothetical protein
VRSLLVPVSLECLVISVTLGTGLLLWAASVSGLYRARKIACSLQ